MKPSEVIRQATALSGESYNAEIWLSWLNMAQAELETVSQIPKTCIIPLQQDVHEYDIPPSLADISHIVIDDTDRVVNLKRLQIADFQSKGYRIDDGKIVIQNLSLNGNGQMKIVGFKKLKRFTEGDLFENIPDIPESAHILYIHYLVARASQREEWEAQQQWAYSEWQKGKDEFELTQRNKLTPMPTRIKVRRWR